MYMSSHDAKILSILIEERNKLTGEAKAYRHQSSIDKLTHSIVAIRNNCVYQEMQPPIDSLPDDGICTAKSVLLKRGDSITLRMN